MSSRPDMRLHHFGILVENIEVCSRDFVANFGYQVRSKIIHDALQAANVRFLALPSETTYIELIAPDSPGSHLHNALKRARGPNHVCFSTVDIEESLQYITSKGAMLIQSPAPAVAFRNLRIAWLMDPHCVLVELVERGSHGELDFLVVSEP